MRKNPVVRRLLWVYALFLVFSFMAYLFLRQASLAERIPAVIIILLVLSGLFAVLAAVIPRLKAYHRSVLLVAYLAGMVFRLLLFGIPPETLSDDVYRYLWDGRVQAGGINPYLYLPDSPELKPLSNEPYFEKINHRAFRTSYPPAAQLFFLLRHKAVGSNLDGSRILYFIVDILIFTVLFRIVSRKGALLYWLCPLVIIEVYIGMHLDIVGILFFTLFLVMVVRNKVLPAVLFLAVSVGIKYVSAAALPVLLFWYIGHRKEEGARWWRIGLEIVFYGSLLSAVLLGITVPYMDAGKYLFSQIRYYAEFWRFNSPVAASLDYIVSVNTVPVRGVVLLSLIGVILMLTRRSSLIQRIRLSILALILVNSAVYPWYLLWLVPFLVFDIYPGELVLISLIPLSYHVLIRYQGTGEWVENPVIMVFQYVPFALVFIIDIVKGRYVQKQNNSGYYPGVE